MKYSTELVDANESTKQLIEKWIGESSKKIVTIPSDRECATRTIEDLQITTKSVLGATIYYYAGLMIDHGWIRILGSGNKTTRRNISNWNQIATNGKCSKLPGALLVADDVLGGFYAVNGNAFEGDAGNVYYLAPDTLEWENLNMQYSSFLNWAILGDTDLFYKSYRWNGWDNEVEKVDMDNAILFYPFLWSSESKNKVLKRSIVSIDEIWNLEVNNMSS
ncbi:MAG TPA: DUF2625 family protein [Clostridia bacterium]|nr:DUF2625 family protein [Clostridia bacterium]